MNSVRVENKLQKYFNITSDNEEYNLFKLDNYIIYNNVVNNVDSHNETSFINKFLKPIFGDCWASHVITQVSLNSLSNITKLKGQRVDFCYRNIITTTLLSSMVKNIVSITKKIIKEIHY